MPASAQQIVRVFRRPGLSEAKAAALVQKVCTALAAHARRAAHVRNAAALTRRAPLTPLQMQKQLSPDIRAIDTELVRLAKALTVVCRRRG